MLSTSWITATVLTRWTRFELEKARALAHILEGLKIALDNLDAVIQTIRASASAEVAFQTLQTRFTLSEIQPGLDMQLRPAGRPGRAADHRRVQRDPEDDRLPGGSAGEPAQDPAPGPRRADGAEEVRRRPPHRGRLDHRRRPLGGRAGPERRSAGDDLEPWLPSSSCARTRTECRGGGEVGIRGQSVREEDALRHMLIVKLRQPALLHQPGKVYQTKAYQIPEFERTARRSR